jgi:hypothetical protein
MEYREDDVDVLSEIAQGGNGGCSNLNDRGTMTTSGTAITACVSEGSSRLCLNMKSPKLRDMRSLSTSLHLVVSTSYSGGASGCIPSIMLTLQERDLNGSK